MVRAHLLDTERRDALTSAQYIVPERMLREIRLHQLAIRLAHGHIFRARDLFEDHVALQIEIVRVEPGAHQIAQESDRVGQILAQDARVIHRLLGGCEGVEFRANRVEVQRDLLRRAARCALEHHMLEKVRHAEE